MEALLDASWAPIAKAPQAIPADELRQAVDRVRLATQIIREKWFDLSDDEIRCARSVVDLLDQIEADGRQLSVLESLGGAAKAAFNMVTGHGPSLFLMATWAAAAVEFRTAVKERMQKQADVERKMLNDYVVTDLGDAPTGEMKTYAPKDLRARAAEWRATEVRAAARAGT